MAAYLLVEAEVTDRDRFTLYAKKVRELVGRHGGEYLVIGGPIELLETEDRSDNGRTIVISRWPSRQSARDFWNSSEYRELKQLRKDAARVRVRLTRGLQ
jgi:uncharacterized protein (DUF1330 family)